MPSTRRPPRAQRQAPVRAGWSWSPACPGGSEHGWPTRCRPSRASSGSSVSTPSPPAAPLGRTEFVRVDIRTPSIAKVIDSARVDTVVHLNLVTMTAAARMTTKEHNVIGTMQLLAACQRSRGDAQARGALVRRRCTARRLRDPAVFTERDEPVELPRGGFAKDAVEVEGYVRGFARRRSDLTVSVLRFANFLGPGVDTPLSRYFHMPVVATVFGHDPRLQFIHEDDGVEILRRMAVEDHPGSVQRGRRRRRAALPGPAPGRADHRAAPGARRADARRRRPQVRRAEGLLPRACSRWLTYGRVVDTTRCRRALLAAPKYQLRRGLRRFRRSQGARPAASRRDVFAGRPAGAGGSSRRALTRS